MKAAVHARYGPPDVVRIAEVAEPVAGPNEVLVRVRATTVNRTDCGFRAGKPFIVRLFSGLTRPRATILGTEFAGVVERIGSHVSDLAVGDEVFGFSEPRFGAHAEHLTMPADGALATMPANRTFAEIAPSTEGSHYALTSIRRARIGSGQRVLVNGATGAIGSAAVQLLKARGAIVTAVCDTGHIELVKSLGADRIIDRTTMDFTRDEQAYDVVLDAVGKSSFARCRRLLRKGGIYMSTDLGPLNLNPLLALVTPLFGGRRVMFPIPPRHDRAIVRHLKELIEYGAFRPVIDRHYPLEEIVEAYRYVETGTKIGNVVIDVAPAS